VQVDNACDEYVIYKHAHTHTFTTRLSPQRWVCLQRSQIIEQNIRRVLASQSSFLLQRSCESLVRNDEGAEVQRCRGAEVQRCRGAEVQRRRGWHSHASAGKQNLRIGRAIKAHGSSPAQQLPATFPRCVRSAMHAPPVCMCVYF
jgi:hypothetical protein